MILPLKLDLNQVALSPKKWLHDPQSLPALSARMSSPGIALVVIGRNIPKNFGNQVPPGFSKKMRTKVFPLQEIF